MGGGESHSLRKQESLQMVLHMYQVKLLSIADLLGEGQAASG